RHAARPTKAPRSLARSKERDRAIHPSVRSARASNAWRSGRNGRFRATSGVGATRRWRGRSPAHAPSRFPARESEELERVLGTADQDGLAVVQKTVARGTERFIDVPRNRADRPLHGAGGAGRDE